MIVALMIGRKGSKGFKGKNTYKILNKPMCEYPLAAAKKSKLIDKIFVATDCPKIKKLSKKYRVNFIERPKSLNNSKALGDHVFQYSYFKIKKQIKTRIDYLVLLFANAPTVTTEMIEKGIKVLKKDENCDAAVSTSVYNMWSPLRARKLDKKG